MKVASYSHRKMFPNHKGRAGNATRYEVAVVGNGGERIVIRCRTRNGVSKAKRGQRGWLA